MHHDDRAVVQREDDAGPAQQINVVAVGEGQTMIPAQEDRPTQDGLIRERLLSLDPDILSGIKQNEHTIRSRCRKSADMQG